MYWNYYSRNLRIILRWRKLNLFFSESHGELPVAVAGSLAFFCGISLHPLASTTFLAFEKEDHKLRLVAFALMIALICVSLIQFSLVCRLNPWGRPCLLTMEYSWIDWASCQRATYEQYRHGLCKNHLISESITLLTCHEDYYSKATINNSLSTARFKKSIALLLQLCT